VQLDEKPSLMKILWKLGVVLGLTQIMAGGDILKKKVYYSDGRWEEYKKVTNEIKCDWGKATILDKWLDSKGNVWYRTHFESLYLGSKGYAVGKISNAGNTLESIYASESYPIEEWEPDRFEYNYQIYYRQ